MAERSGPGRQTAAFAALLAASFALRLCLALRPLPFLDDLTIPDDAYLSLTLARNIARGLGPLYALAPTNGFQPLYVFLMAPVYAILPRDPVTPVHVALVVLALFDTAALWLIMRLVARFSASRLTPLLAGAAWVVSPYAIHTSLNAIETSMAFFFLVAMLDRIAALRAAPERMRRSAATFGLGLLLGLAALARIDSLLMVPVIAVVYLAGFGLAPRSWWPLFRALLATALGALLVYLPWLLYSHHWTGDFFPVSGRAVRYMVLSSVHHRPTFDNLYRPMLERAMGVIVRKNALMLGLIPVLFAGLAFLGARVSASGVMSRLRALLPLLAFSLLLLAAYVGFVFGPWHFGRYLFPLSLALLLVFAALVDLYLAGLRHGAARLGFALACAALVVAGSVVQPPFRRLFAPRFEGSWGYMRIGLWARSHFPAGTVIGGAQTGALGYFADSLTVVNLDGVVNKACYEAMRQKRMLDYIRSARVRHLVWQDDIEFIARESANASPGDVALVRRIEGFRTWGGDWYLYRVGPP